MKMKEGWKDMLGKAIEEDLADPNGYWNTIAKKEELKEKRYDRFEEWLKTNDFETLLKRSIYKNRKNILQFICKYVSNRLEVVNNELLDPMFESGSWFFKGYWFQLLCGQGCFWKILDADLNCIEQV